jgi:hypothetical protein
LKGWQASSFYKALLSGSATSEEPVTDITIFHSIAFYI